MFKIRLQQFEGPLDLLLFFIRRDELDIHDIPISSIADEFLEYVTYMEEIDLDGVGDFLYMAAVLINIKARLLLPSKELNEEGDPIDPRAELIERLLEYVRFKEAAEVLVDKYDDRAKIFTRGASSSELNSLSNPEDELIDATVFDLISALRKVLTEAPDEIFHEIVPESYTLEEQQLFLKDELLIGKRTSFIGLAQARSKSFIITTFLAILEMARLGEINIFISGEPDNFFIELVAGKPIEPILGETLHE